MPIPMGCLKKNASISTALKKTKSTPSANVTKLLMENEYICQLRRIKRRLEGGKEGKAHRGKGRRRKA